jgi:SynChlorMet cassette protein ScmD
MSTDTRPIANHDLVLREEFDDWAILFDPDSGDGFGLNPVGVFIWKRLDGEHTEKAIFIEIMEHFDNVPEDAEAHLRDFIESLLQRGFAGYEIRENATEP